MIKVIKVTSDNFEQQLMTKEVYDVVRCQMSTGDFHTHKHEEIEVEDYSDVITEVEEGEEVELVMKKPKQDKTVEKYITKILSGARFEKSEIGGLTKLISSYRFATQERKDKIEHLQTETMECVDSRYHSSNAQLEMFLFVKPCKITKEQTELGKAWLRNHFFKLNGLPRGGKNTEDVSDRVLKISKQVSRFEFVGVIMVKNQWSDINQVLPIYRTFNRKGEYFDYAPIHWGQPVIMEGL